MLEKLKINKKTAIIFSALILLFFCLIFFTYYDCFLYNKPIVKVLNEKIVNSEASTDVFGKSETLYTQKITAQYKNGDNKGKTVDFERVYYHSQAIEGKIKTGDYLFVSDNINGKITVSCIKRDYLLTAGFCLFVIILLLVGRRKGSFTLISLILNVAVTLLTVFLFSKGLNIIILSSVAILFFIVATTVMINGRNVKSLVSIISTIISISLSCLIIFIVIFITKSKGVYFEQMELVINNVVEIFYIQLIIGNLGGIMDICVSMSSSINELYLTNPDITYNDVKKSAKTIGSDIMGTMATTILFAYLAGSLPMIVLLIKNGYTFTYIYENHLNIEIIRALTGCIGLVISIPISTYISIKLMRKKELKK